MSDDPGPLTAGITYNLKKGVNSYIEDIEAEYDDIGTIQTIKGALEQLGCKVKLFEANADIFEKLKRDKVDIMFNIAEGIRGRGREAQIPAILNYLGIPFVGSDETTLCISLDKALTKRLLSSYRIKTPKYKVVCNTTTSVGNLKFPLIVKPNAEGSSKGISDFAIVDDSKQLKSMIARNLELYNQPLLIEEFIQGREFTVGIVGNDNDAIIFSPMEIAYKCKENKYNIYSFNVKKNYKDFIQYICPPDLDESIIDRMKKIAGEIYKVLECKDFSRVDFRLSDQNEIYFIEINPLPGLAKGYSDYPMLAEFCGVDYNNIIKMILNSALKRHGLDLL